jgi:hypothetical protein
LNINEKWDDLPVGQTSTSWGANISRMEQTTGVGFLTRDNPTYLPFRFTDTTDSSTKYGYVALATWVTGSGASAQLNLSISGYAFDDSGAQIAMGAVPEPSTTLMAAIGAMLIIASLRSRHTKSKPTSLNTTS